MSARAPKPDTNEYDRLGLAAPDKEGESCFTKAMAMIDRAEREGIERPDMGMEWRLMPVDEPQERGATLPNGHTDLDRGHDHWNRVSRAERDRLAIRFLSDKPLTIGELTTRFGEELPDCAVYEGAVRSLVKRLFTAGELGRRGERYRTGDSIRYRYFHVSAQLNASSRLDPKLREALDALRRKCRRALPRAGITTVEQVNAMSDDELLTIPGIGWKSVAELRDVLAARDPASKHP